MDGSSGITVSMHGECTKDSGRPNHIAQFDCSVITPARRVVFFLPPQRAR